MYEFYSRKRPKKSKAFSKAEPAPGFSRIGVHLPSAEELDTLFAQIMIAAPCHPVLGSGTEQGAGRADQGSQSAATLGRVTNRRPKLVIPQEYHWSNQ